MRYIVNKKKELIILIWLIRRLYQEKIDIKWAIIILLIVLIKIIINNIKIIIKKIINKIIIRNRK
jgi:hypothetical protein